MEVLYFIIGIIIGAGVIGIIFIPKAKKKIQINKTTIDANQKNQELLKKSYIELEDIRHQVHLEEEKLETVKTNCNSINQLLDDQKNHTKEIIEAYKQNCLNQIEQKINDEKQKYNQAKQDYQNIYLQTMVDSTSEYREKIQELQTEYWKIVDLIDDLEKKESAAVDAAKRAEEMKNKANFYKLVLAEEDKEEIQKLRQIIPQLKNPEPLNKVIWKVYYEKPYTDLIGRVVGAGVHCGIYKITNTENQMCYVGQAVNITNRWKQHIKRGIGAEAPTRNKLYPAMLSLGVENFSFEIIEECDQSKLNDREDYWQEFFKAKEFGYSIK